MYVHVLLIFVEKTIFTTFAAFFANMTTFVVQCWLVFFLAFIDVIYYNYMDKRVVYTLFTSSF